MTLIRKMATRHEVRRRLEMVAMVVGVLVSCLSVVAADRRCGDGMKVTPYMRSARSGPCVSETSPVLVVSGDTLIVEELAGGTVMDGYDVPARRKLGSGETAGSVITSIIFLVIVAWSIWCCCTGRCCGSQQSVAQATAQATNQSQTVVVNVPEQKAAPAFYNVNNYGPGPGTMYGLPVDGAVATAHAGTAQATAQAAVNGPAGPAVEMVHMHTVGVGGPSPGPYNSHQQAQYPATHPPPPQQQAHYPPPPPPQAQYSPPPPAPQQQEPSPLSNYPSPKIV